MITVDDSDSDAVGLRDLRTEGEEVTEEETVFVPVTDPHDVTELLGVVESVEVAHPDGEPRLDGDVLGEPD